MRIRGTTIAIGAGSVVLIVALTILMLPYFHAGVQYVRTITVPFFDTESPSVPALNNSGTSSKQQITFVFVGDLMFDRHIRKMARLNGEDHILSCVSLLLQNADITVGNLEGPITNNVSVSEGSIVGSSNNFQFTFPLSTAPLLRRHGFDVVSLGNNHIGDFGTEGAEQTRASLDAAGVAHFGGLTGNEPIHRASMYGTDLSFVAYNQFGGDAPTIVAERIQAEQAAGRTVIVFAHWGEEYVPPTPRVREIARSFVAAGAALVIGAHPHVIQESEIIDGVPVYYSLGNFVFDQYWNQEVSAGLLLQATFTPSEGSWEFKETRVRMLKNGKTCSL